ncbi:MAG: helix-hairpin-helix domain-containing protein [Campylobacterota bacterium]|nr:helix-hairpin-helix domain-containing protein [Campylobacterota bacterium]
MKHIDRNTISKLEELPNVGKTIAKYLRRLGITKPAHLIHKDPYEIYELFCKQTDKKADPCLLDVFISIVEFMKYGAVKPWWEYTDKRKKDLIKKTPPK